MVDEGFFGEIKVNFPTGRFYLFVFERVRSGARTYQERSSHVCSSAKCVAPLAQGKKSGVKDERCTSLPSLCSNGGD